MSRRGSIDDIRRGLALSAAEEAEVRAAARKLEPAVEGWIEAFYLRLVLDPAAMEILADDARVVRLKRSLTAWFHEMFALPLDDAYAQARAEIGRTHLRIGMPAYLMVTAMSGLRADVRETVCARLGDDPGRAARVARGLEKLLDLELCLMLGTYAEEARRATSRRDRDLLLTRMTRRLAGAAGDTVDAVACYAELVRRGGSPEERACWTGRLEAALGRLARGEARGLEAWGALDDRPRRMRLAEVCARALLGLPPGARSRVAVRVEPADFEADVLAGPLEHALAELLDNALRHDPVGTVRLSATRAADSRTLLEVSDAGPGWPPGADVELLLATSPGLGLAYALHVAALHGGELRLERPAQGGALARLLLAPPEGA